MSRSTLCGISEAHLCGRLESRFIGVPVHRDVVAPFFRLRNAAAREGFDLVVLSGFRSFESQLSIWNRKVRGERAVLDSDAKPIDISRMSDRDLVFAILRWSALPGASRHHWGTDLDVYDAAARPEGYEIELIPEEVDSGGMFGPLHDWLDRRMSRSESFGFFRPYDLDRNGVAPERWHLSCAPVADPLLESLTPDILRKVVEASDMERKQTVLDHLDEIYERFVINVARPEL